jgi:hypothetical protein
VSDRHAVVNHYIAMWNETDARRRGGGEVAPRPAEGDTEDPLRAGG